MILPVLSVLTLLFSFIFAFNLESNLKYVIKYKIPDIQRGRGRQLQTDSMFGFSLAFYNNSVGRPPNNAYGVLVGAPTAVDPNNPTSGRTGAVYFCPVSSRFASASCTPVPVDQDQPNLTRTPCPQCPPYYKYIPYRDNSLLGFTVATEAGGLRRAMVCAPRWSDRQLQKSSFGSSRVIYNANGMCYMSPANRMAVVGMSSWSKIMAFNHQEGQTQPNTSVFANAQSGFSGSFLSVRGSDSVMFSAPGYWNGLGTVAHAASSTVSRVPEMVSNILYSNSIKKYCLEDHNCYLGFSLASGNLFGSTGPGGVAYVSGMPRAGSTGMVAVYKLPGTSNRKQSLSMLTNNLDPILYFKGTQFAESFGYCVVVLDLNGDGRDDVLVGAPYFTDSDSGLNVGAVYGFLSSDKWSQNSAPIDPVHGDLIVAHDFRITGEELGSEAGARFGVSLANLGDLNRDGFNDFAIGSPFGKTGGAVHVVYGGQSGISKELTSTPLVSSDKSRGFGWGLTEGSDADFNSVNDLAVGDITAESIFIFRSRPVMTWNLTIESDTKQILATDSQQSIYVTICVTGQSPFGSSEAALPVNGTASLDRGNSGTAIPRAFFRSTSTSTMSIQAVFPSPLSRNCFAKREIVVERLRNHVGSSRIPLTVDVQMAVLPTGDKPAFCAGCFVLSPDAPTTSTLEIPIVHCLPESIACTLDVTAVTTNAQRTEINDHYRSNIVQGENSTIVLRYKITNQDTSFPVFGPRIRIGAPPDISVTKFEAAGTENGSLLPLDFAPDFDFTETQNGSENEFHYIMAVLPVGPSRTLFAGQTTFFAVTLNTSGSKFDSEGDQLCESLISATMLHDPLNGVDNSTFTTWTTLTYIPAFSLQILPNYQLGMPEVKLSVDANKAITPSGKTFDLEFKVINSGPSSTVPTGYRIQLDIPIGFSEKTYLGVSNILVRPNGSSPSSLTCSRSDFISFAKNSTEGDGNMEGGNSAEARNKTYDGGDRSKHRSLKLNCAIAGSICHSLSCELPSFLHLSEQVNISVQMEVAPSALSLFDDVDQGLFEIYVESYAKLNSSEFFGRRLYAMDAANGQLQIAQVTSAVKIYFNNHKLPIWIIITGVCGALLFLTLIVLILWRVGFFRRQQMEDEVFLNSEGSVTMHVTDDEDAGQGGFLVDRDFQKGSLKSSARPSEDLGSHMDSENDQFERSLVRTHL